MIGSPVLLVERPLAASACISTSAGVTLKSSALSLLEVPYVRRREAITSEAHVAVPASIRLCRVWRSPFPGRCRTALAREVVACGCSVDTLYASRIHSRRPNSGDILRGSADGGTGRRMCCMSLLFSMGVSGAADDHSSCMCDTRVTSPDVPCAGASVICL